ncbi:hypothetical protein R5W23_005660 [Gemmata sp. JC673]|uniref:Uncharacterized protein n=1 Tax=Gemmata algarum TaxID=2975278 RepID=A0ABU5EVP8_9BACT|nr:hypothetical protein [Gemmata algarum]MDY3558540.1 hypothetical protein [Gemmata algarum]
MGGPPDTRTRSGVPEWVLAVARRHVAGFRPPRGRRWCEPDGVRVPGGWYFNYAAERIRPRRHPDTGFGFAPGYVVDDDGSVRTVGWGELREVHGLPAVE